MENQLQRRVVIAFFGVLSTVALGALGFYILGEGRWTMEECLYMAVITLTTVGFGEVLDGFHEVEYVRTYTIFLIIMGMGVFLYFASTLTAFIIEGDLRRTLESTRMRKRISQLRGHVIVCGIGATGRHVVNQLVKAGTPVLAIDNDDEQLRDVAEEVRETFPKTTFLYLCGDATDDHVLDDAGLERAAGLVATLANDKDNLYLVVSARQSHPDTDEFRIVARGIELTVLNKMRKAGADAVVSPNYIGGLRLASEMLQPTLVRFVDDMVQDEEANRITEVTVSPESRMVGRSVRDLDIRRRVNVSILAARTPDQKTYNYNPGPELVIEAGMTLVILGTESDVTSLRDLAS